MLSGRTSGMTLCSERACFVACVFDILKVRVLPFENEDLSKFVQFRYDYFTQVLYELATAYAGETRALRAIAHHAYCFRKRSALLIAQPSRRDRRWRALFG